MRVLTLATEFPPAHGYGLGRYVSELTAALAADGCEVAVACNNWDGGLPEGRCSRAGVEVGNAPAFVPVPGYTWVAGVLQGNVLLEARALEMARRNGGFELLHIHDWLAASAAKSLRDLLGLPLVVTMHDTVRGRNQGQLSGEEEYIAQMEGWACEQADLVLANSSFIRRELAEAYAVPEDKLAVAGCGVNPDAFASDTPPQHFKLALNCEGSPLIVFVGRMAQAKGPQVLLEAAPHVLKLRPDARFIFAGEGTLSEPLRERAAQLGIAGHTRFVGHLRGQVLATLYRTAQMVVVPSLYEPLGMVALEAMACGTPVVAADTGGLHEIMAHGECALPAPPNDPATLARAILHLLQQPERAAQFARRGAEVVREHYRWPDVARRTLRAYERVVA